MGCEANVLEATNYKIYIYTAQNMHHIFRLDNPLGNSLLDKSPKFVPVGFPWAHSTYKWANKIRIIKTFPYKLFQGTANGPTAISKNHLELLQAFKTPFFLFN
jgi:hypothetical protein